jgi:hypothetical protein
MERAAALRSAPQVAPAPAEEEVSSTVMFRGGMPGMGGTPQGIPGMGTPQSLPGMGGGGRAMGMATPAPRAQPVSPEEQKAHEDAKRFARLVVSEIKLYNEQKVLEGRRSKNIYEVLKDDIERGRQMYTDRVPAQVRDSTNYFYDELVRILAGGDASALGA